MVAIVNKANSSPSEVFANLTEGLNLTHQCEVLFNIPRQLLDLRKPVVDISNLQLNVKKPYIFRLMGAQVFTKDRNLFGKGKGKPFRAVLQFSDSKGNLITGVSFAPWSWIDAHFGERGNGKASGKPKLGQTVPILGTAGMGYYNTLEINVTDVLDFSDVFKLAPIYPAIRGKRVGKEVVGRLTAEEVAFVARYGREHHLHDACDFINATLDTTDEEVKDICGYFPDDLLHFLHFPESVEQFVSVVEAAKKLAIKEILVKAERVRSRNINRQSLIMATRPEFNAFQLTPSQDRAVDDVISDLRSGRPMMRLLTGDVGFGKSAPMLIVAYAAHKAGAKVAIMVPNEPLVSQLSRSLQLFFPDAKTSIITGRHKDFDPKAILIGTSALCNLKNYVADFIIVDEQHKYSREQREALCGPHTNMLEASATAIPRSVALITHGGMDVSPLTECPVEKDIRTHLAGVEDRMAIYDAVNSAVQAGNRCLLVYPLVSESDKSTATTVDQGFDMWDRAFPGLVVKAHGLMKAAEKNAAIDSLKDGSKLILVASSVAEVGLDIPNTRVGVVVRPQQYGMNQLHQIRGRLARNGGQGDFFLYPEEEISDEALSRLNALVETNNGYEIAERDMELRGFGDLDEDSEMQKGVANSLFRSIDIRPSDLEPKPAFTKPRPGN